jgi:hypothetical protein
VNDRIPVALAIVAGTRSFRIEHTAREPGAPPAPTLSVVLKLPSTRSFAIVAKSFVEIAFMKVSTTARTAAWSSGGVAWLDAVDCIESEVTPSMAAKNRWRAHEPPERAGDADVTRRGSSGSRKVRPQPILDLPRSPRRHGRH